MLHAGQLLEAVSNAERERSAAPGEVPLGEWAAVRVRPSLALHSLTTQLQLTQSSAQVSSPLACHFPQIFRQGARSNPAPRRLGQVDILEPVPHDVEPVIHADVLAPLNFSGLGYTLIS